MRKPAGVIVAAVVLGLMTALALLGVIGELVATLIIHNPVMPTGPVGYHVRIILSVFDLIAICVLACCAWTVVGLFRMRNWARYSIVVLGVLTALLFGALSVIILLAWKFVPVPQGPAGPHLGAVIAGVSLFYAAIGLIGVWWVVYFNLRHVRQAFAAAHTQAANELVEGVAPPVRSEYGPWRAVVIALAVLTLFGGVTLLGMGMLHLPVYLFGFAFSGPPALLVVLLMAAIQFFIGIGLLRRIQAAYWTAIGWQAFGILAMAFLLSPSARVRLLAYQTEISQRFSMGAAPMPSFTMLGPFLVLSSILSLIVLLVFLYALLRCRHWYVPTGEY